MILTKNYSISFSIRDDQLLLGMQFYTGYVSTSQLKNTYSIMARYQQSVLLTTCFNDYDLPFYQEVLNTELGHLFEHLLLDNLCIMKMKSGAKKAVFAGVTDWNWKQDPYGYFRIKIDMTQKDRIFLDGALKRSISVLDLLIDKPDFYKGLPSHS